MPPLSWRSPCLPWRFRARIGLNGKCSFHEWCARPYVNLLLGSAVPAGSVLIESLVLSCLSCRWMSLEETQVVHTLLQQCNPIRRHLRSRPCESRSEAKRPQDWASRIATSHCLFKVTDRACIPLCQSKLVLLASLPWQSWDGSRRCEGNYPVKALLQHLGLL